MLGVVAVVVCDHPQASKFNYFITNYHKLYQIPMLTACNYYNEIPKSHVWVCLWQVPTIYTNHYRFCVYTWSAFSIIMCWCGRCLEFLQWNASISCRGLFVTTPRLLNSISLFSIQINYTKFKGSVHWVLTMEFLTLL